MKTWALSLLLVLMSACEKAWLPKNPANSPAKNFQILWETIDEKYAFLELKAVPWDSLRHHYRGQITPNMSDRALFSVLDRMLLHLRDGHVNLVSPFDLSRSTDWYLPWPDNFDAELVERNYLEPDLLQAGGLRYVELEPGLGYIRYASFSSSIRSDQLSAVINYFQTARGLIIDIRSNGGGALQNAYTLSRPFLGEDKAKLVREYKTGPGREDFGRQSLLSLDQGDTPQFQGKVVLLQNRRSYSAANTYAALMSQISKVTTMGDTTGGGGGLPMDYELPNGWRLRYSATRERMPDGHQLELGIPPDIAVQQDTAALLRGEDQLIEKALDYLR